MKQIYEYVSSFVTIALILAGIGGAAYHMFKEGGWLSILFGKWWNAQIDNPMIAVPVTIAVLFFGKLWYDYNVAKGYTSKLPNILIYIVMAAGFFFIWQFFSQGMTL